MASAPDKNPQHHTQNMKRRLQETVTHLREAIQKVDEPQLKAMFETSAEVLNGLMKAFSDYEKKNEAAWRKSA
jgi:ferric iron reductase protein FhuF